MACGPHVAADRPVLSLFNDVRPPVVCLGLPKHTLSGFDVHVRSYGLTYAVYHMQLYLSWSLS